MRIHRVLLLVAFALSGAGCAGPVSSLPPLSSEDIAAETRSQQIAHIRKYYGELHRVDSVAFRLRTANRAFCRNWVSAQIGLHAATPRSLPRKYQSYSAEALNLTWARPTAISVVEGSPAAQAGIVTGDEIIALNGELIPVSGTAGWMGGWLRHNGVQPVEVNVRRDGADRTVTVTPVLGCAIPIDYVADGTLNAFTDGNKIVITSAILALVRTEPQLAVLIGHELAHATMGHLDKGRWNRFVGWAGGAAVDTAILLGGISTGGAFQRAFEKAGGMAYSVGFEREADYVGAYFAARAGYDLGGAEELWQAFGQASPASIRLSTTHPTTPERFLQMRKVAAEIDGKRRLHLPLVPELKIIAAQENPETANAGDF